MKRVKGGTMIEIICNEENSDKSKKGTRGAAIRRPKNIKQIGEVNSDKKIYIEDYAFTYINSIADRKSTRLNSSHSH